jgi:hypothetical protein
MTGGPGTPFNTFTIVARCESMGALASAWRRAR